MNRFIQEELDKTKFKAIVLNEAQDLVNKFLLSTCLNYVNATGDLKDRSLVIFYLIIYRLWRLRKFHFK